MTKDEIAKLPTPETDSLVEAFGDTQKMIDHARSIEQRLTAATHDLEHAMHWFDQLTRRDADRYAMTLDAIKELNK